MMDLLKHLIPDFAHMFSANPNGISAWFWSATALIFVLSLYFLLVHFRRFRTRLRALRGHQRKRRTERRRWGQKRRLRRGGAREARPENRANTGGTGKKNPNR